MLIDDAGGLVFRPPSEARSFIYGLLSVVPTMPARFAPCIKTLASVFAPLKK